MSIARVVPLLLLLSACREPAVEERELGASWAASYCAQVFSCDCAAPGYPSRDACEAEIEAYFDEARSAAEAAGLTYDDDCAARKLADVSALDCDRTTDPAAEPPTCERACATYHGDADVGEPCETFSSAIGEPWLSTCRSGLRCVTTSDDAGDPIRACSDPCADSGPGEGMPCVTEAAPFSACAAGLLCFADSGMCEPPRSESQPCGSDEHCERDLWCPSDGAGFTGVCTRPNDLGESCDYDHACSSGFCDDDRCARLPTIGQPCDERCAPGSSCAPDERPQAEPGARICFADDALVCSEVKPSI